MLLKFYFLNDPQFAAVGLQNNEGSKRGYSFGAQWGLMPYWTKYL